MRSLTVKSELFNGFLRAVLGGVSVVPGGDMKKKRVRGGRKKFF